MPGPGTVRASGLRRVLGVAIGCAAALALTIPASATAGTVSATDPAGDVQAKGLTSKERAAIDIESVTVSGEESLGMLATVEFAGKFTKLIGRGHLKKGQAELELQPSSPDADPARLTTKGAGIVGKTVRDTSSKKVGAVRDGDELTFFIFGPGFSSVANAEVSTFARRSGGAVASQETGAADTAGPLDILPRPLSCDELKAERDLLRRAIDSRKEQRAVVEKALDETNEAIKKKEASVKLTLLKLFRKLGITRPAPIEESIKGLKEIREGLKKQLDKLNHDIAEFERELEKIEARIPAACAAGPSPGGYDEFPIPTSNSGPTDIASQNPLWFTEELASKIGMATTDGAISDFGGLSGPPTGIAVAGGKIWATVNVASVGAQDRLARFSSAGAFEAEIEIGADANPSNLTTGPDGNLWFPLGDGLGARDTSGAALPFSPVSFSGPPCSSSFFQPLDVAAGPSNTVWVTGFSSRMIAKVRAADGVVEGCFTLPGSGGNPYHITQGPDGNLWFTATGSLSAPTDYIGRATPAGAIDLFPLPDDNANPCEIAAGPDGNVYFTEEGATEGGTHKIGRITPAGDIARDFGLPFGSLPNGITTGSDGNLWVAARGANKIVRIPPSVIAP